MLKDNLFKCVNKIKTINQRQMYFHRPIKHRQFISASAHELISDTWLISLFSLISQNPAIVWDGKFWLFETISTTSISRWIMHIKDEIIIGTYYYYYVILLNYDFKKSMIC